MPNFGSRGSSTILRIASVSFTFIINKKKKHIEFRRLNSMEVSNESMPSLNMQSQTLDSENFFEIFDSAYAFQLGPLNSLGTSTSDQFNFSVSNEARVSLNDKDAEVNITNEGNRSLTESIERLKPAISSNERAIENKRVFTKVCNIFSILKYST